ncbi:integrating conjugative element protein [Testudinibacter sp. P80/BLE/0925]|uniref:integrating conjugative element protein n=1 Tax=Testudinibacter sp. TW-1 TaxID=3417757 RepID=UPI003D368744
MSRLYHVCLVMLAVLSSQISVAALRVIADVGGESAVRFYEPLQPVHDDMADVYPNAVPPTLEEKDLLPIVSHLMSPGKVNTQTFSQPLVGIEPLFLLGSDGYSQQWLHKNKVRLLELNATGLVVNVSSFDELLQLRAIAPELPLLPVSADDLAKRLNLSTYPALLTADGIYQ